MNDFVNGIMARLRAEFDLDGGNENQGRARRLLLSLVEDDPAFQREPKPRVVVTTLNDHSVALELQAWIEPSSWPRDALDTGLVPR